jgi:hypothetical protein
MRDLAAREDVYVAGVDREDLFPRLGVLDRNGWLFIIAGALGLLTAITAPVFAGASARRTTLRHLE